jgi:hypothetical protein
MKRLTNVILGVVMVCLLSIPAIAATTKVSSADKTSAPKMLNAFTKPETLTGALNTVQLQKRMIVVTNPSGVPFDFKVAHAEVEINGSSAKLGALSSETGKHVSVRFVPMRSGDVAQRISIGG